MDLKCLEPGEGGWYDPAHLPLLGTCIRVCVHAVHSLTVMHILAVGGPPCNDDRGSLGGEYELSAGDTVRVDLDLETTKLMQEGHGGWDDAMADVNLYTCTSCA